MYAPSFPVLHEVYQQKKKKTRRQVRSENEGFTASNPKTKKKVFCSIMRAFAAILLVHVYLEFHRLSHGLDVSAQPCQTHKVLRTHLEHLLEISGHSASLDTQPCITCDSNAIFPHHGNDGRAIVLSNRL